MRTIIRNNYDPHTGDYHERIIQDEAREKTWLFDCDGVYLDITAGRGDVKVVNELGDSEVDATSQKLVTDELGKKQDTLVAGDNITIEGNVISAGGGNYTAGYGLTLTGAEFAANTSVLATQTDLAGKQDALSQAQLAAVNSGIDSGKVGQIAANASDIDTIEGKIPAQASSSNQLADKDFVNSSVATNTANYISNNGEPFASLAQLEAYSGDLSNNDYAFVVGTDSAGNTTYTRYKYVADIQEWAEEYVLNNSSFTANQWASINSGITSGDVTKLAGITAGAEPNAIDSISVNGTTVTPDANKNVDLGIPDSAFIGTDGTAAGAMGLVPAPATTDAGKFLKADGTWDDAGTPINVVQTTGISTTNVMSQKAVTSMVYSDPATRHKVRIGNSAFAGEDAVSIGNVGGNGAGARSVTIGVGAQVIINGVAIGYSASCITPQSGGIALGPYSQATTGGEMNIGSTNTEYGYKSSNYRLLTGLYDPQSAHDAATKGYVDGAVINGGTTQPTTSTVGAVGTQYNCVNNGTPEIYICTDTTGGTYTWTKIN